MSASRRAMFIDEASRVSALDLYEDLLVADDDEGKFLTIQEVNSEKQQLSNQVQLLKEQLSQSTSNIVSLREENERLKKNLYSLLETAKLEIERKNKVISRLSGSSSSVVVRGKTLPTTQCRKPPSKSLKGRRFQEDGGTEGLGAARPAAGASGESLLSARGDEGREVIRPQPSGAPSSVSPVEVAAEEGELSDAGGVAGSSSRADDASMRGEGRHHPAIVGREDGKLREDHNGELRSHCDETIRRERGKRDSKVELRNKSVKKPGRGREDARHREPAARPGRRSHQTDHCGHSDEVDARCHGGRIDSRHLCDRADRRGHGDQARRHKLGDNTDFCCRGDETGRRSHGDIKGRREFFEKIDHRSHCDVAKRHSRDDRADCHPAKSRNHGDKRGHRDRVDRRHADDRGGGGEPASRRPCPSPEDPLDGRGRPAYSNRGQEQTPSNHRMKRGGDPANRKTEEVSSKRRRLSNDQPANDVIDDMSSRHRRERRSDKHSPKRGREVLPPTRLKSHGSSREPPSDKKCPSGSRPQQRPSPISFPGDDELHGWSTGKRSCLASAAPPAPDLPTSFGHVHKIKLPTSDKVPKPPLLQSSSITPPLKICSPSTPVPPKIRSPSTPAPPKIRSPSTPVPPKIRSPSTPAPPKIRSPSTPVPPKIRSPSIPVSPKIHPPTSVSPKTHSSSTPAPPKVRSVREADELLEAIAKKVTPPKAPSGTPQSVAKSPMKSSVVLATSTNAETQPTTCAAEHRRPARESSGDNTVETSTVDVYDLLDYDEDSIQASIHHMGGKACLLPQSSASRSSVYKLTNNDDSDGSQIMKKLSSAPPVVQKLSSPVQKKSSSALKPLSSVRKHNLPARKLSSPSKNGSSPLQKQASPTQRQSSSSFAKNQSSPAQRQSSAKIYTSPAHRQSSAKNRTSPSQRHSSAHAIAQKPSAPSTQGRLLNSNVEKSSSPKKVESSEEVCSPTRKRAPCRVRRNGLPPAPSPSERRSPAPSTGVDQPHGVAASPRAPPIEEPHPISAPRGGPVEGRAESSPPDRAEVTPPCGETIAESSAKQSSSSSGDNSNETVDREPDDTGRHRVQHSFMSYYRVAALQHLLHLAKDSLASRKSAGGTTPDIAGSPSRSRKLWLDSLEECQERRRLNSRWLSERIPAVLPADHQSSSSWKFNEESLNRFIHVTSLAHVISPLRSTRKCSPVPSRDSNTEEVRHLQLACRKVLQSPSK